MCRFAANKFLKRKALHHHTSEQTVEWMYAFDIHCNSFLPMFMLLYGVTPLLLCLAARSSCSRSLATVMKATDENVPEFRQVRLQSLLHAQEPCAEACLAGAKCLQAAHGFGSASCSAWCPEAAMQPGLLKDTACTSGLTSVCYPTLASCRVHLVIQVVDCRWQCASTDVCCCTACSLRRYGR